MPLVQPWFEAGSSVMKREEFDAAANRPDYGLSGDAALSCRSARFLLWTRGSPEGRRFSIWKSIWPDSDERRRQHSDGRQLCEIIHQDSDPASEHYGR